jgi:SulP family sulfate permease
VDLLPAAFGIMIVSAEAVGVARALATKDGFATALYRVYTRRLGQAYGVAARPDFVAVAAMLRMLVFDTLPGLFIGIAISLLLLLYRASRPQGAVLGRVPGAPGQYGDVDRHPENREVDGVKVLRVEGGLFFANADSVRARVREHAREPGVAAVVFDAETMPFIDVSGVRMMRQLDDDLEREHVRLFVARDIGQVRDVLLLAGGSSDRREIYPTIDAAVDAARQDERRKDG